MFAKFAIFWTLLYACSIEASLNIFLEQQEVRRLLGLSAELYYVREGVINEYALNFIVPVSAHTQDLNFSWQALEDRSIPYSASVEINGASTTGDEAMLLPTLNISSKGNIPWKLQVFSLTFHCTGRANSETDVVLHLNVTLPHNRKFNNVTQLKFKRKKICLKVDIPKDTPVLEAESLLITSSDSIYIACGTAAALVLVLLVLVALLYFRKRKTQEPEYDVPAYASDHNTYSLGPKSSASSNSYATIDSLRKYQCSSVGAYQVSGISFPGWISSSSSDKDHFKLSTTSTMIPRFRITLRKLLQEGTFGRVYSGLYLYTDPPREGQVLVKTVAELSSLMQKQMFLKDGLLFAGLNHANLLPVIGWCIDSNQSPMILYQWTGQFNLKQYLAHQRSPVDGLTTGLERRTLMTRDVVDMAIQIAKALLFLHKQTIVHKDIATRNCMYEIDDQLKVKLADAALSRDLFPEDYHCLGDNENRPVKWMAIESLARNEFTTASDTWSFGVVLWELATLAREPFAEVDPFEMEAYLREDYRLAQPLNCPDELFAIMACCWIAEPVERPTLTQLTGCLKEFHKALGCFI